VETGDPGCDSYGSLYEYDGYVPWLGYGIVLAPGGADDVLSGPARIDSVHDVDKDSVEERV
jgi:hypothetical protein